MVRSSGRVPAGNHTIRCKLGPPGQKPPALRVAHEPFHRQSKRLGCHRFALCKLPMHTLIGASLLTMRRLTASGRSAESGRRLAGMDGDRASDCAAPQSYHLCACGTAGRRRCAGSALGDGMPRGSRTFRTFVSSTFSDLVAERNALHEHVWPKLRELCMSHGWHFWSL